MEPNGPSERDSLIILYDGKSLSLGLPADFMSSSETDGVEIIVVHQGLLAHFTMCGGNTRNNPLGPSG
jgi:hypothetical protein